MFRKADPDHMLSRGTTYVRIFGAAEKRNTKKEFGSSTCAETSIPGEEGPIHYPAPASRLEHGVTGRLPRTDVNATRQGRFGHIARRVLDRHARSDVAGRQMLRNWLALNAHMRRG